MSKTQQTLLPCNIPHTNSYTHLLHTYIMHAIAIIPARMGSSRFPGKPLADIHGMPMIGHVALRTALAAELTAVCVATCDTVIADYCERIGIPAIMTGTHHERCTTRCAEALPQIEALCGHKADIVVMVQGDEPMITPEMISASLAPFATDPTVNIVNLMAYITTITDFDDPNEVKVITDLHNNALYFSREAIPSRKKGVPEVPMRKQVCVIPFRRDYLLHFNELPETPLERIESIDMLRLLEHGEKVHMVPTAHTTQSVDTPTDLARVRELMRNDPLMARYHSTSFSHKEQAETPL